MKLYEILVPTKTNEGKPIRTRMHKEWDSRVRRIASGLTIMTPVQGQWVSEDELCLERMIPVRIACSYLDIESIAKMTAKFYDQKVVMFYAISENVYFVPHPDPHAPSKRKFDKPRNVINTFNVTRS